VDWGLWISVAVNVVLLSALFAGKRFIEAGVEKSIQHRFDQQLAITNSDLRAKETEIAALRETVLGARSQRQALLEKRKLEAVERIWVSLTRLAPFVGVSRMMRSINFEEAAKRVPQQANLRQVFNVIAKPSLVDSFDKEHPASHDQPFLSPLAWAYYSAYSAIVLSAYTTARVLAEGVEDAGKLLIRDSAKELLKTILPHQSDWIESNDPCAYDYLLDEIKDLLLSELKRILEGHEADKGEIEQSKRIAEQLRKMQSLQAQEIAAVAKIKADKVGDQCAMPVPLQRL
jgi:hypothetical protein